MDNGNPFLDHPILNAPYGYPEHKINLFSNYKPRIVETDEGIWDKLFLLEFDRYFAPHERDKKLREKLFACAPDASEDLPFPSEKSTPDQDMRTRNSSAKQGAKVFFRRI